jgi:CRP/FNR family transcriptional activator FtrB
MNFGSGPGLGRETVLDLRLAPLFSGLPETDLLDLLRDATVEPRGDGEELFRQGQTGDRFFIVLDGHVELHIEGADGRRSVIEVAQKPAIIGESVLFGEVTPMGARVLGRARLLVIPVDRFRRRLEARFDLMLLMLGSMSFRLRVLVRQIAELKLKTTAQRLGGFLLSLIDEKVAGQVQVRFPYDKRIVAEKLGMKPESLSRALGRLAAIGVRSLPDNSVVIGDVERLRRFSIEEGLD